VLLLDEPLSNLDAKLRVSTRIEIRKLQQRVGITSVYVTHDQDEAMTLSDRVVIMRRGKIQQVGTPKEIYAHPLSRFVAGFIGKANFLEGDIIGLNEATLQIDFQGYALNVSQSKIFFSQGDRVLVVARPESIELEPKQPERLTGKVAQSVYLGSQMIYEVDVNGQMLTVEIANPQDRMLFSTGEEVSLRFREKSLHALPYEKPSDA
jgi:iron(III) transport system ATP-binding protein